MQTYIYMTAKLRKTRVNCRTEVPYREINLFREMRCRTTQEGNVAEKETMTVCILIRSQSKRIEEIVTVSSLHLSYYAQNTVMICDFKLR